MVMGVLLVIVFLIALPFTYVANQVNTQSRLATATADTRATADARVANATATQQAQAKATAAVASTATSGVLILSDTLSSNTSGRWTENTTCAFTGNSYQVIVQQANSFQICPSNTFSFDNATIQVEVSLLSGNLAGLIFRASGNQYYDYEITDQGEFFLRRHIAGTGANYTYLVQNTKSDAIATVGQKNTLLVIASGDDFKLFINRVFVGEAHDGVLTSGQLGFATGTLASTNSGRASFTNLKVFKR